MAYINEQILINFNKKRDGLSYQKLISLLKELNNNCARGSVYSTAMLIRAILDHVPPLLGYQTFQELVNNYPWPKTDKNFMQSLLDFRNEADHILHTTISEKQDFITKENIPKSNRLNILLQECVVNGGREKFVQSKSDEIVGAKMPKISFEILERAVSWANYSAGNHIWSSFRIALQIDNFRSNLPDYISVSLTAHATDDEWIAPHFLFETSENDHRYRQDEDFRIEKNEQRIVGLFISDQNMGDERRNMPDFDRDTLVLHIKTKSGVTQDIPVPAGWIRTG